MAMVNFWVQTLALAISGLVVATLALAIALKERTLRRIREAADAAYSEKIAEEAKRSQGSYAALQVAQFKAEAALQAAQDASTHAAPLASSAMEALQLEMPPAK